MGTVTLLADSLLLDSFIDLKRDDNNNSVCDGSV